MADAVSVTGIFLTGMGMALHPCPLTTNIAVVTLLVGWRPGLRGALLMGLPFVLGYAGSYAALAVVLSLSVMADDGLARALQEVFGALLGPALVFAGMIQLELLPGLRSGTGKPGLAERLRSRDWGPLGACGLGVLLALALCPATAALLFGGLLQALRSDDGPLLAVAFGLGAALPLFGVVLAIGSGVSLGDRGGWLKRHLPPLTGLVLIGVGLFLTIRWAL